jgi:hypothetical protein
MRRLPARPPIRSVRAPRLNVHFASFNHGRRIAFDAGIEELCKRAQLDREDRNAMFRLLEKCGVEEDAGVKGMLRSNNEADFDREKPKAEDTTAIDLKIKRQAIKDQERAERGGPVSSAEFQKYLGKQNIAGGRIEQAVDWILPSQPLTLRVYNNSREAARAAMLAEGYPVEDVRESEKQWVGEYIPDEKSPTLLAEIAAWQPNKQQLEAAQAAKGPTLGPEDTPENRDLAYEKKKIERAARIHELNRINPDEGFRRGRKDQLEDEQARYMEHLLKPLPKDPGDRAAYDAEKQRLEKNVKGLQAEIEPAKELTGEGGIDALGQATDLARAAAIEEGMKNVTLNAMNPWQAASAAAGRYGMGFREDVLKAMEERLPREHGRMVDPTNPDRPTQAIPGWKRPLPGAVAGSKYTGPTSPRSEQKAKNQALYEQAVAARAKATGAPGPVGPAGPVATATPAYTPASPSGAAPSSAQQAAKSINRAGAVAQQAVKAQAPQGRGQIIASPEDIQGLQDFDPKTFKGVDLVGEDMGGEPSITNVGGAARREARAARKAITTAPAARQVQQAGGLLPPSNPEPPQGMAAEEFRQGQGEPGPSISPSNPEPENMAASESARPSMETSNRTRMEEMAQEALQQRMTPPPKSVGADQGQYDAASAARSKALLTPPALAQQAVQKPQAVGAGTGAAVSATSGATQQPGAAGNNLLAPGAKIPPPPAPDLGKGSSKAKA